MADGAPVAFIDATAGIAGDMLLGALVDAGAPMDSVRDAVTSLGVPGLDVELQRGRRAGLACARIHVSAPREPDRERRLADVLGLIDAARLSPAGRDCAQRVFRLLARAEGDVHGRPADEVHFHEVGAFDALADVVGVTAALDDLGLLAAGSTVRCSSLAAGSGTVATAHGRLPVPAPAVLALAVGASLELGGGQLAGERTTPTGAAVLAAVAEPGPMPDMRVQAVGVGGGTRDTPDRPNVTRVILGAAVGPQQERAEGVLVIEATVDDLDPQLWPSVLDAVRTAGAWDCWTTPMIARHGRPGQVLSALCAPAVRDAVVQAVFVHSSTLGVRWSPWVRAVAPRHSVRVDVGPPDRRRPVTVKIANVADGVRTAKAEIAEAEDAARVLGWSVRAVCAAAVAEAVAHTDP